MIKSIITAISDNNIIGYNNTLPWHLPADLQYFKSKTLGKHIIMGRKTFESFGKPLLNRTSIIITNQKDYKVDNCIVVNSLNDAFKSCNGQDEVFIIGGKQIYEQALKCADRLYISEVHGNVIGDTEFPIFDKSDWMVNKGIIEYPSDYKNKYDISFKIYERSNLYPLGYDLYLTDLDCTR